MYISPNAYELYTIYQYEEIFCIFIKQDLTKLIMEVMCRKRMPALI